MSKKQAQSIRKVLTAAALALSLALVGCDDLKSVEKPSTRVLSARLVDETDEGARILVEVELTHKNKVALPLVNADYSGEIQGIGDYDGQDLPNRTLPINSRQVVTLPMVYRTDEPVTGLAIDVSGNIEYQPPGEIRKLLTESGIPLPKTGFSGRVIIDEAAPTDTASTQLPTESLLPTP